MLTDRRKPINRKSGYSLRGGKCHESPKKHPCIQHIFYACTLGLKGHMKSICFSGGVHDDFIFLKEKRQIRPPVQICYTLEYTLSLGLTVRSIIMNWFCNHRLTFHSSRFEYLIRNIPRILPRVCENILDDNIDNYHDCIDRMAYELSTTA